MKLKIFLIALFFTLTSAKIYAEAPKSDSSNLEVTKSGKNTKAADDAEKYKKVMDEYKAFLSKTTPAIRDEIREYRKEVVRINKEKTALYKKLSQEAQDFLRQERGFKKQLPFKHRKALVKSDS